MALVEHVEHFQRRVMQDALAEATASYWRSRADTFAKVGTTTADAIALACRRHAWLVEDLGLDADLAALIDAVTSEAP